MPGSLAPDPNAVSRNVPALAPGSPTLYGIHTRTAGPSTAGFTDAGTVPQITPFEPTQVKLNVLGFAPVFWTSNHAE